MSPRPEKPSTSVLIPLLAFVLLALSILLMIPAVNQGIYRLFGIDTRGDTYITYSGLEEFTPFTLGYLPAGFEIIAVASGANSQPEGTTYTETYASPKYFIHLIQGEEVSQPAFTPDPGFTLQDQPASLVQPAPSELLPMGAIDLANYDLSKTWLLTTTIDHIRLQVITNLPRREAIRVTEGLVPTSSHATPTP
jgi:hypothetical protein